MTVAFFRISSGVPDATICTVDEDGHPVGKPEHHAHVVLDDHERASLADAPDQIDGTIGLVPAHAGGRFIEQDHIGAAGDGDGDLKRPLFGIGEDARRHLASLEQIEVGEDPLGACVDVVQPIEAAPEGIALTCRPQHGAAHVLPYAHAVEDVGHLKAARQPATIDELRRLAGDIVTFEQDRAGGRRKHSTDQIEQGGFAGPVRSDDRVPLAPPHRKIDAADDLGGAEVLRHAAQFNRGCVHGRPRASAGPARFHAFVTIRRARRNARRPPPTRMMPTSQGPISFACTGTPRNFIVGPEVYFTAR